MEYQSKFVAQILASFFMIYFSNTIQWMFGLFITLSIVILGFVLTMQWQMHRRQTRIEAANRCIRLLQVAQRVSNILEGSYKSGKIPEKWDGRAAKRIVQTLLTQKMHLKVYYDLKSALQAAL